MNTTTERVPPLAPGESYFNITEDTDSLLVDAKLSLHCVIGLIEGYDLSCHNRMQEIRREEMAGLLRLIGIKLEHAHVVYRSERGEVLPVCQKG